MIDLCAIPTGHTYLVDCTHCGPLGTVDRVLLHTYAYQHMTEHGIEMPTEPCCDCGYNYAHITGHPGDRATCTDCDWTADGIFADHMAHHHHLDTRHTWDLVMGDKR